MSSLCEYAVVKSVNFIYVLLQSNSFFTDVKGAIHVDHICFSIDVYGMLARFCTYLRKHSIDKDGDSYQGNKQFQIVFKIKIHFS